MVLRYHKAVEHLLYVGHHGHWLRPTPQQYPKQAVVHVWASKEDVTEGHTKVLLESNTTLIQVEDDTPRNEVEVPALFIRVRSERSYSRIQ